MTCSFSITQSPTSSNLILYPDAADSLKEMTAVGAGDNYLCIDEAYDVPDDDTTYVYTTDTSVVTDIYRLPNHTSETGTINYVKVFARAKSHNLAQAGTGVYKLLVSTGAATYSSSDINLTTDYTVYYNYWTENPATSAAWTWADIDNLKIGVAASSPSVYGTSYNLTLRPNAVGDITQLTPIPGGNNWACVDDAVPDSADGVGTNSTASTYYSDFYNIEDHTAETGTINSVKVFNYAYKTSGAPATGTVDEGVRVNNTNYWAGRNDSLIVSPGQLWYHTWNTNPNTLVAWTWADIDSLQIGTRLQLVTGPGYAYCYQSYAIVNYTEVFNPQIRTTQCYAVVNYTASSSTCYLIHPSSYTYSNNREIKKQNPWNGTRYVYDLRRVSKNLTMTGKEYYRDGVQPEIRLNCVNAMKDNGTVITISGIGDTLVDTDWLIQDFNYGKNSENPYVYDWTLTLERYENT